MYEMTSVKRMILRLTGILAAVLLVVCLPITVISSYAGGTSTVWSGSETAAWEVRIDTGLSWASLSVGDTLTFTATEVDTGAVFHLMDLSWDKYVENVTFSGDTASVVITQSILDASAAANGTVGVQGTGFKLTAVTLTTSSTITEIWSGSETADWSSRIETGLNWSDLNVGDKLTFTVTGIEAGAAFHLLDLSWTKIKENIYISGNTAVVTITQEIKDNAASANGTVGVQGNGFTLTKVTLTAKSTAIVIWSGSETTNWGKRIDTGLAWSGLGVGDKLTFTATGIEAGAAFHLLDLSWTEIEKNIYFSGDKAVVTITQAIKDKAAGANGTVGVQGNNFTLTGVTLTLNSSSGGSANQSQGGEGGEILQASYSEIAPVNVGGVSLNTWEEIAANTPSISAEQIQKSGVSSDVLLQVNITGKEDKTIPAAAVAALSKSSIDGLHVFVGGSDAVTFLSNVNYSKYTGVNFKHNDSADESSKTIDFEGRDKLNAVVIFHTVIKPDAKATVYKVVDGKEIKVVTFTSNENGGICFAIDELAKYVIRY